MVNIVGNKKTYELSDDVAPVDGRQAGGVNGVLDSFVLDPHQP